MAGGINLYVYVANDPVNSFDPYGLNRRGRGRYYNQNGLRNPYAEYNYYSLRTQIRKINPSFSVLRDTRRNITWRDVNWMRDQLVTAQHRALARSNYCGKRPGGVPPNWIRKPSKDGGGVRFIDPNNPHNSVRVMPGDPSSPHPNSRMPYVRRMKDGSSYDVNGNVVPHRSPDSHIPVQVFRFYE